MLVQRGGVSFPPPRLREPSRDTSFLKRRKGEEYKYHRKKKAIQFTVLSPFLSLFFFFSLYFSFIPFLLHALTNSFLFLFFFVLPNFHYRGKLFYFSFFLPLSPFSFSLISFSFLSFSLSAFGRIIFQILRR